MKKKAKIVKVKKQSKKASPLGFDKDGCVKGPGNPAPQVPPEVIKKAAEIGEKVAEDVEKLQKLSASLTEEEQRILNEAFDSKPTREKILRRLKRQMCIEDDEINTLFPNDEELVKFYLNEVKGAKNMELPEEGEQDSYKLTEQNERDIEEIQLNEERAERRRAGQLKAQMLPKDKKDEAEARRKFEESQKDLPEDARTSYEDYVKSVKEGLGL
jgi:hypothetical protein